MLAKRNSHGATYSIVGVVLLGLVVALGFSMYPELRRYLQIKAM